MGVPAQRPAVPARAKQSGDPAAVEIELKLLVSPEHTNGVWRALAKHSPARPTTKRLFSAYYDTPERKLAGKGIALRLRRDGRHWIQTIKGGGGAAGGLHQRLEHETAIPAQLPYFPAMVEAGFGDVVAKPGVRESVRVVFVTDFRRTSTIVSPAPESRVEVSLDRGEIVAEGRHMPICEIELELKAGPVQCLFDLALEIAAVLPVRLENRSKAQRAHELAIEVQATPAKASAIKLDGEMPVTRAFATLAFGCIAQLQANETGLLAGRDPEYLHQARVALRRLRSVFRLFRQSLTVPAAEPRLAKPVLTKPMLTEIKTLGRLLGEARDWDVFVGETVAAAAPSAPLPPGLAAVKRRALAARRQARQAAVGAVAAPAYTATMIRLVAALHALARNSDAGPPSAGSLKQFASDLLAIQHGRVLKRGRRLEQLAYPDLHRLRIEVKRLRYAAEFFASVLPGRAQEGLRRLATLQDLLGTINDDVNAWALLDQLAAGNAAAEYQQAVGYLRGHTACDARHCLAQLPKAWARFEQLRRWW